jgi:hypothetical protein
MQFLLSVIHDAEGLATPTEDAAIDVFNDELQESGEWVFAGGLGYPRAATVIDNRGDEPELSEGPFQLSQEYLAGFWIVELPDLDTALERAKAGSKACNRKVEVRQFM